MEISKVKKIREQLGCAQLIIIEIHEDGEQTVSTHGDSAKDAKLAAKIGNNIKKNVLGWLVEACNAVPLERICKNCQFWKMNEHTPGYRIPEQFPGKCMFQPTPVSRLEGDTACGSFQPNR